MKLLSIFILLAFFAFKEKAVCQISKTNLIEHLISDLYKKQLFNGAIVIGEKGKILFSKGYGYANFQDSLPFTPNTSSDGGSNAKTLTATSILLLAEAGKLKLNDPMQRYLPNYPYVNTTVWNLITHSVGGLPDVDYFFEQAADTVVITNALNLSVINKNKPALAYPPNTNFYYDNVGFDLAALVVEQFTGMGYNQFLKEKIFGPLKMNSSFIRPARFASWKQNRTIGYRVQKDSMQVYDIADREGFYGGSNIWFSATDLYHWGESFYHNPILSNSLIKKITSTVFINNKPSHVRLGAWYSGKSKNAFYYWGNVAGFYSWVYWDMKKRFTIAFMTNTAMPQWVRPLLTSALINIMQGSEYLPIEEPKTELLDKNKLEQIAGTYRIENVGKVEISVQGLIVILKESDKMEYRMHLVDKKTFYIPGFDPWISFGSLKENKFQNIFWNSTILQAKGKRISN